MWFANLQTDYRIHIDSETAVSGFQGSLNRANQHSEQERLIVP